MGVYWEKAGGGLTNIWLTPPWILEVLGTFDLDPCACENRPWEIAKRSFTYSDDGLSKTWEGRVWLNPPYGVYTKNWLKKMAKHKNGLALVYARTETKWFYESIWSQAQALLFIKKRIRFYHADGTCASTESTAPHVLVAWDEFNANCLENCRIKGGFTKNISARR